ncbi:hypothetical protein R6Q59_030861 [Mikania micrantha]|uniref:Uncharacterized protein n=1 Tax=Mikania micrantha TaxID=192012 RepID=A0A5N6NY15_9ASTR|nr:hypothetical protein E3N88_16279 [Mikania micrantha]
MDTDNDIEEGVNEQTTSENQGYYQPFVTPLIEAKELTKLSFYRAIIAEFVATFLYLYLTIQTIIGYKSHNNDRCGSIGLLGVAWVFGGMIFVLVYNTSSISGGHLNPAITFAMLMARKLTMPRALMYILAQCSGATCGCLLAKALQNTNYKVHGGGVNELSEGYSRATGLGVEIVGTFILVYTALSTTDPKRTARDSHVPVLSPLPIGFAVFMVHLATIPITETGINPARSFGAAVIYNKEKTWDDLWIFWAGPMIGAIGAEIYYEHILQAHLTLYRKSTNR